MGPSGDTSFLRDTSVMRTFWFNAVSSAFGVVFSDHNPRRGL